jgi:hypothetical protein
MKSVEHPPASFKKNECGIIAILLFKCPNGLASNETDIEMHSG